MSNSDSFFERIVNDFIKAKHINYSEECIGSSLSIQPIISMKIFSASKILTICETREMKKLSALLLSTVSVTRSNKVNHTSIENVSFICTGLAAVDYKHFL